MTRKRYFPAPHTGADAKDTQVLAFAKNLSRLMLSKGWNQSDLARAAQVHMPPGKDFGRHLVSSYVRGASRPLPTQLDAIAKALGVKTTDLIPEAGDVEFIGSPVEIKLNVQANNRTRIKLDMEVDTAVALKIADLISQSQRSREENGGYKG